MRLPFAPPLAPMLSRAADALPAGDGWQFEPKWDGFRTIVFRDGDEVLLQNRDEKPINRYFPELVAPLAAALPARCVVDGEIVIVGAGGLDFEALLLRIHPAASRVKLLAAESPASFVAWDLLALGDEDLREAPLATRRARLEQVLTGAASPVHLSPATRDRALAEDWFRRFEGAGLDGVMDRSEAWVGFASCRDAKSDTSAAWVRRGVPARKSYRHAAPHRHRQRHGSHSRPPRTRDRHAPVDHQAE